MVEKVYLLSVELLLPRIDDDWVCVLSSEETVFF